MIHLILVSHHNLAKSFLETIQMIAGEEVTKNISTICMTYGKDPEEFLREAQEIVSKHEKDQFLIFADLYGASPCNTMCMALRGREYRIVTGMNLGMCLDVLFKIRNTTLENLSLEMEETGKKGVQVVYIPDC